MEQIEIHKRYQTGIKTNPQNGSTNQQDDKFMKRMVPLFDAARTFFQGQ
jgi:hypothetical protein